MTSGLVTEQGHATAVCELLLPIVGKARAEPGCKHCALLEVQTKLSRLLIHEIWTGRAVVDAHIDRPDI